MAVGIWINQHCRYEEMAVSEIEAMISMGPRFLKNNTGVRYLSRKFVQIELTQNGFCDDCLRDGDIRRSSGDSNPCPDPDEPPPASQFPSAPPMYAKEVFHAEEEIYCRHILQGLSRWARFAIARSVMIDVIILQYQLARPAHSVDDVIEDIEAVRGSQQRGEEGGGGGERKAGRESVGVWTSLNDILREAKTFAWFCDTAGKSATLEEHVELMNKFAFLFDTKLSKANLKKPGIEFAILRDMTTHTAAIDTGGIHMGASAPTTEASTQARPCRVYVGRVLARAHKRITLPYKLPLRPVLGPTSLDATLATLMCNLAEIQQGSVVLDPFCGTGSILISAAALGAVTLGSDIDKRVVRGWGVSHINPIMLTNQPTDGVRNQISNNQVNNGTSDKMTNAPSNETSNGMSSGMNDQASDGKRAGVEEEQRGEEEEGDEEERRGGKEGEAPCMNMPSHILPSHIFTNFDYYGLPLPDVAVMDAIVAHTHSYRDGFADAVITDPPYGVRAHVGGKDSETLYGEMLQHLKKLVKPGGLVVFLQPSKSIEPVSKEEIVEAATRNGLRVDKTIGWQQLSSVYGRYCICLRSI